jgi:hypothetical protein
MTSRLFVVYHLVRIPDGPDVLRLTYTKQSPETVNAAPRGLLEGGHGPVRGVG